MDKKNLRKNQIFYTFPLFSDGGVNEVVFSITQFNVLKLVSNCAKIKSMARALGCQPPNIRHHLNKLEDLNLVFKTAEMGVWRVTNEGKQVLGGGKRRKVVVKKEVVKKGCIDPKRQRKNNLTELQSKIYYLIIDEGKTQESVALLLNKSQQNISKHYRKALEKLHILGGNKKEVVMGMSLQPLSPQKPMRFRAHNYRWSVKFLEKLEGFKVGSDKIGNCNIKIWGDKIQIISKDDFFGDTEEEAFFKGLDYFNNLWRELEKLYKIKICYEGVLNKNLYQCDIANINNELARVQIGEGNKFYVRDSKGIAWAVIDNSFRLFEFETIHSKTVLPSMENCQKHLNDWRDKPESLTNSQLTDIIQILAVHTNKGLERHEKVLNFMQKQTEFNERGQVQHDEILLMMKAQIQINHTLQQEVIKLKSQR